MAELSGQLAAVRVSGALLLEVGLSTTDIGDAHIVYQITNATKQVLDRIGIIRVHKKGEDAAAETGTNTTNIKISTHGLAINDLIVNTTRGNAARLVTAVVDVDNVTVAAIPAQTTDDNIERWPTELVTAYTLSRLDGKVTYAAPDAARFIKISGSYYPMTTVASAHEYKFGKAVTIYETPKFGMEYKNKLGGTKFAYGTLNRWDFGNDYMVIALTSGVPIVIEFKPDPSLSKIFRVWALFENGEIKAAVDSAQDEIVSFISTDEYLQ